jgi:transcriptional regulator with XRE-family HTH domain
MVRSRGDSPAEGGANLMPASVPDIARSLRLARLRAELTVREAATRAGLDSTVIEALESGDRGQQHDRITTLRSLRAYADALGLPGDDYVLAAVEQWPSSAGPVLITGSETAVVPVVSISSAPAGGHSPAGGHGSVWPGEATGVPDATTTGVMDILRPTSVTDTGRLPALDTGRVPVVDTGQVPAVHLGVPRLLTFMTVFVAFLVVLGGAALIEHNHINGWFDSAHSTTTHWIDDAKSALGITSNPPAHGHHTSTTPTTAAKATHASEVTMRPGAGALSENISVAAKSFTVKVLAVTRPCWVDVTVPGQLTPLYEGDLQAGESHSFVVTGSLSVETGSAAGGTQFYEGFKLLGYYFPPEAPFTINFTAAG